MKKVLDAVDKEKPRMLPIDNYQKWLIKQTEPDKYGSINNLSQILGINNKKLDSLKSGTTYGKNARKITTVSVDIVDKSAILTGGHITDIYPDYYEWPNTE